MASRSAPTQALAKTKVEPGRAPPRRAGPHVPRPPWAPVHKRTHPLAPASAEPAADRIPEPKESARLELAGGGAPGPPPPPEPPRPPNRTGLPDELKAGIEALSGLAIDDVRVHRNSSAPASLGALAYAQGSDIHLAPGQERHLPHEAWHVVQQKQGRVAGSLQRFGSAGNSTTRGNDDPRLEAEATRMGESAERWAARADARNGLASGGKPPRPVAAPPACVAPIQLTSYSDIRQQLVDRSRTREKNIVYRRILADLVDLAVQEQAIDNLIASVDASASASSSSEESKEPEADEHQPFKVLREALEALEAVRRRTHALIQSADDAASTAFLTSTREARNNALEKLKAELKQKLEDLKAVETQIDNKANARSERLSAGTRNRSLMPTRTPQAGFEMEFPDVWVLDPGRAMPKARQYLLGSLADPDFNVTVGLAKARYSKRTIVFGSPEGTWEGTADTTLAECSNLEIVTKPLTAEQWQEEGGAAEADRHNFLAFQKRLSGLPSGRLLHPAEALPESE